MVPHLVKPGLPWEERAYHQFWRTPTTLAWRPIVAILLGLGVAFLVILTLTLIALGFDPSLARRVEEGVMTPTLFLVNNLGLAALIPIALLLNRWPMRQPAGFISSVVGRLRWKWLFTCVLVALPIWILQTGTELFLGWSELGLKWHPHSTPMIIIILLTQVFQCAGEEYAVRGVVFRGVGSLIPPESLSFLVAAGVSSVVFMFSHGAGDPWLNTYYLTFGACSAFLTWRTGGLEAAIAVHCVNNLLALSTLPFSDLSSSFNREAGVGSPWMLINMGVLVIATASLNWVAKRKGILKCAAPGQNPVPPHFYPPQQGWPTPPGYQPTWQPPQVPNAWQQPHPNPWQAPQPPQSWPPAQPEPRQVPPGVWPPPSVPPPGQPPGQAGPVPPGDAWR